MRINVNIKPKMGDRWRWKRPIPDIYNDCIYEVKIMLDGHIFSEGIDDITCSIFNMEAWKIGVTNGMIVRL